MEKIVIVSSRPEPDHGLLASLSTLFPECEVQIVFKKSETVAQYPANCTSDRLMAHAGDIAHLRASARNNYTSCLSFGPSTTLHPPAHISICTGRYAL